MTITTPTLVGTMPLSRSGPWAVNNDEDDAGAAQVMKLTPGVGHSLYLTHITIAGRTTDVAVTLEDTAGLDLLGPIQCQADGGSIYTRNLPYPMKLPTNTGLNVIATDDQAFTCYVEGFTAKDEV